ncbi:hypothetical protein GCM10010038_22830 [Glutamicibacter protophormiae]|nr:hypothetical protein GCM10010038_22830 [Glutamicibacter protophormiae]
MLKSRVLRSRSVALVEQEIYALLIVHQLLRNMMAEATNTLLLGPSAAVAAQMVPRLTGAGHGGATLLGQHPGWLRRAGPIGARVLAALQPARRLRTSSRTVKRSNSNYQARAGNPRTPTRPATLRVEMLGAEYWLTPPAKP